MRERFFPETDVFIAPHPRPWGSSLIDVVVALLIFSIGLLGFLGLQTMSLKANRSTYYRSVAVSIAEEVVERERANAAAADVDEFLARTLAMLPSGQLRICQDATPNDGSPQVPACDGSALQRVVKVWWDDDFDGVAEARVVMMWAPPG